MQTLVKANISEDSLAWNRMHQDLYDKAKMIIKKDACMKFNDASMLLYVVTDASGISLGGRLLQVRNGINCGCDKVPDNANLCQIAFSTKSL